MYELEQTLVYEEGRVVAILGSPAQFWSLGKTVKTHIFFKKKAESNTNNNNNEDDDDDDDDNDNNNNKSVTTLF